MSLLALMFHQMVFSIAFFITQFLELPFDIC